MDAAAFSTPFSLAKGTSFTKPSLSTHGSNTSIVGARRNLTKMTTADVFQWKSLTREAKQAATPTGVFTVQCSEASAKSNDAESARTLALARQFRLRQTSAFTKYADLFATRRAAIVQCDGSHSMESYVVKFPARASAFVQGRAEALKACDRYMSIDEGTAEYLMNQAVVRQYSEMKCGTGVYSALCTDGTVKEMAETSRISSLATKYRSKLLSAKEKAGSRYESVKEATKLSRGCSYEESYYQGFPESASAMRWGNGSYAAMVLGAATVSGKKMLGVEEQINGENLMAYWPSYPRRAAVTKEKTEFWTMGDTRSVKNYGYMSAAAVAWGTEGQGQVQVKNYVNTWSAGWQPTSVLSGAK